MEPMPNKEQNAMMAFTSNTLWRFVSLASKRFDMVLFSRLSHALMAVSALAVFKAFALFTLIFLAFRQSVIHKKNGRRLPQSPNQLQCHVPKNKNPAG
jgi:hypothetical protein